MSPRERFIRSTCSAAVRYALVRKTLPPSASNSRAYVSNRRAMSLFVIALPPFSVLGYYTAVHIANGSSVAGQEVAGIVRVALARGAKARNNVNKIQRHQRKNEHG